MRTIGLSLLCLGACAVAAPPLLAHASQVPARLSLAEAVRLAEQSHPSLAAAGARVEAAAAGLAAARERPNPVLAFSAEGYRPWAGTSADEMETVLAVSQEIETGGRRRLRSEAAAAGVAANRAGASDSRRQVRLEVERAYFRLVLARSEADAAAAALSEVDRVIGINRARYRQGEVSGGELRRLEVERMRFSDDVVAARLSEKNARGALLSLLGAERLDAPLEPTDGLTVPAPGGAVGTEQAAPASLDAAALTARALAARPDLAAVRQAEVRAQRDWQLQRALRLPTLAVGAGYRRDYGQNGLVVTGSLPLPLFARNAAGIARAEAERRLAASEARQLERAIALEVQQAVNTVEAVRTRLAALESDYLSAAKEARDSALAAYRSGATGLIDYLDAQRAYRDVQRTYQRTLFEHRLGLAELEAVVGHVPGDLQP